VKRGGPCLAYSQALQHLQQESRVKIPVLVIVQFSQDPTAAEVGQQNICHHRCLLVRDGINLWPLGEVVHRNEEVLIPHLTLREITVMSMVIL
jgi:hypothetical protein